MKIVLYQDRGKEREVGGIDDRGNLGKLIRALG